MFTRASFILGITRTEEKLVFSDSHAHHVNCFNAGGKITRSMGGSQGMQDGFTVRFQSPSSFQPFIEPFQLKEKSSRKASVQSSSVEDAFESEIGRRWP